MPNKYYVFDIDSLYVVYHFNDFVCKIIKEQSQDVHRRRQRKTEEKKKKKWILHFNENTNKNVHKYLLDYYYVFDIKEWTNKARLAQSIYDKTMNIGEEKNSITHKLTSSKHIRIIL